MPRQIFRDRVLAAAGPLPGQLTLENLKKWTEIRRGEFSEDFDETVTHLLCTQEQFHKRVPRGAYEAAVKEALARGKRFHIVHYDWFEHSTIQEKRQPEREFSMRNMLAKQNAAKRELARIEKGKREGERFVNTNLYHIYTDRDFFPYQIDITRNEAETGDPGQRYTLSLWESNAKPNLYWFTAKFLKRRGDSQPSYYRPSRCSGKWRREMDLFMDFFRIKTGVEWQDRVLRAKTMPGSFFQYSPPAGGKPVGRRLRFCYRYCLEVNAHIRGLPWPPVEKPDAIEARGVDAGAESGGEDFGSSALSRQSCDTDQPSSAMDGEDMNPQAPLAAEGEADARSAADEDLELTRPRSHSDPAPGFLTPGDTARGAALPSFPAHVLDEE